MNKVRLITSVVLASSILATPVYASQKRKSLFQVLFPKAYEERQKREQAKHEALKPKKLVKVKTSKNYVYKTVARAPIAITPLAIELASVGSIESESSADPREISNNQLQLPEPSRMTKDLHAAKELSMRAEKHLARAVSEYYSVNQEYAWIGEDGDWNARAKSVMRVLRGAAEYGLRPEDYTSGLDGLVETVEVGVEQDRLVKEITMTTAVLQYAMDARHGTINPNRLSGYHDFPVHYDKSEDVLDTLMGRALPANTLKSMHPSHDKFEALRAELAAISDVEEDIIDLPTKILIKPGNNNEALHLFVDAIHKRSSSELLDAHSEFLNAYDGSTTYTKEAVALVKAYQKEVGLGADGIIGRNTATKLAGIKSEDKTTQIKLAMERLRWLPKELGERHVFINQPEYRARYIEDGNEKLSMRVVVGKKSNQTNFFYDEIEHVVYNPYWGVPRSIIVNEFLPKSIGNPGYLDQKGYEITNRKGQRISSASVNWSNVGLHPNFNVRQPPGSANALGDLKIMFPNKHAIYMHDTPAKSLFNKQHRAFSHGCVRLHDPHAMAAAVLGKPKSQIKAKVAQGENRKEFLNAKVPVYVAYFTAWPQADGSVKYFHDMYGRDAHLSKAIEATRKSRAAGITS